MAQELETNMKTNKHMEGSRAGPWLHGHWVLRPGEEHGQERLQSRKGRLRA